MDFKLLKKCTLFHDLSDADLKVIAVACEARMHHAGDLLFSQGDVADSLFVVNYGSVRIFQEDRDITVLASGETFGEIGLVYEEHRTATGEVVESSQITHVDYAKLQKQLAEHPKTAANFYKSLARALSQRLSATTEELGFAMKKRAA